MILFALLTGSFLFSRFESDVGSLSICDLQATHNLVFGIAINRAGFISSPQLEQSIFTFFV